MPKNTVYLEAPDRTQDLLDIKWALRSAGYAIRSSWHDCVASTSLLDSSDHWNRKHVEELQACDLLVVVCGKSDGVIPEVSMMAGFALARGLRVIWIGPYLPGLTDFRAVQQFDTAEEFRRHILEEMYSQPASTGNKLAA